MRGRLRYLDPTRGLFILLMISSHAIGLADVASTSVLQSIWWLPRCWSTAGFVMLAGFSVGVLTSRARAVQPGAIMRRAWHLVIVMFASNAIMAACRELVRGNAATFRDWSWLADVIMLQRDMTISGALLPIAVGLVIVAGLLAVSQRIRPAILALVLLTLNAGAWIVQGVLVANAPPPAGSHEWMRVWLFSFPLLPLACSAATGFAFGLVWRSLADRIQIDSSLAGPVAMLFLLATAPLTLLAPRPIFLTLNGAIQFGIILVLAVSLAALEPLTLVTELLALLGRFSLMVFILHRPMLHAAEVSSRALHLSPEARYALMLVAGVGGCATLCLARKESAALDRLMKRVLL